jgi:hypothetical protein
MSTPTSVTDRSEAVKRMAVDWALVDALLGGTKAMRRAGRTYLPQWPKETNEAYDLRVAVSVLFPAYKRTVHTLAGKPFSKPITLGDDVPERFKPWLQDIDLQGRNLDAFAADVFEAALGYGIAGILVDFPPAGDVRTQAQELAAGLRPYWIQIRENQILGWRSKRIAGAWQLTQLRLLEVVEEDYDDFGTEEILQVRVLEPGKWSTYRLTTTTTTQHGSSNWAPYEAGVTSLNKIPFVPVYGHRLGFMLAQPPMLEVAHLNVAHWQSASDQQNILHVARVPMLAVIGVSDTEFKLSLGASSATNLPEGADMKFVEHSGSAIEAGAKDLDTLEERMRQAGAELLVLAPGRITATQVATENAVGMCVLQRITQSFEDALDQALQITAEWVGEVEGGHVTVFNDFGAATLAEASAQLLLETNKAGKLSDETLHSEYQRRGILSADLSWEEEQERIELQGPALDTITPPSVGQNPAAPQSPVAPVVQEPAPWERLLEAIAGIQIPAPVINMPAASAPQITVESPQITVNVPEQPAPIVTVEPASVVVNMPEQPGPVINVAPPAVTVEAAD